MFPSRKLTMESVDFQSPILFKEITAIFETLKGKSSTNDFIDASIAVSTAVAHHTNITLKLDFDEYGVGAYVLIPELTNSHALFYDMAINNTDGLTMIRKAKTAIKGTVDTKANKVTGVFKEVLINVHMPKSDFAIKFLEPGESAAVFLHELGHAFTFFEYLSRSATTNQVLAGITKALDHSDAPGQREIVLSEVAKSVGLSNVDVKSLAASPDKRVISTVVINALNKQYASETGYDIYDITSGEALADQYATRMGAGRDLVTGLDKMYKKYGNISYRTSAGYLMVEATKLTLIVLGPYIAATMAGAAGLGIYAHLLGWVLVLNDATEFGPAGRYDMPGDRFKRVRAQLVEKVKNRNLNKAEVAGILTDIEVIDTIISAVNDRRQFFAVIDDVLTSQKRFGRDMKLLQQSLEKLAANNVFISAAKLNQLAQ